MSNTTILLLIILLPASLFLLLKINQLRALIRNHGKSDRDYAADQTDMEELGRQMELGKLSLHRHGIVAYMPKKSQICRNIRNYLSLKARNRKEAICLRGCTLLFFSGRSL